MKGGLRLFDEKHQQQNPYIHRSMDKRLESMTSAFKDGNENYPQADFRVVTLVAESDVVVHTQLLSSRNRPEQGALRQAHVFKFKATSSSTTGTSLNR